MGFREDLLQAKASDNNSTTALIETYKPLLIHQSTIQGRLDEDLYQSLVVTLLRCIHAFRLDYTGNLNFVIDRLEDTQYNE